MSNIAINVENLSKRYPFDFAQDRRIGLKEEQPETFPSTGSGQASPL